jgi:alpha-L-fucosidase
MRLFLCAAMFLTPLTIVRAGDSPASGGPVHYLPKVESLKQAEVPEWFRDGKLGIFMHWGPESIPGEASTWYARWMYEQGSEGYKYHCAQVANGCS